MDAPAHLLHLGLEHAQGVGVREHEARYRVIQSGIEGRQIREPLGVGLDGLNGHPAPCR